MKAFFIYTFLVQFYYIADSTVGNHFVIGISAFLRRVILFSPPKGLQPGAINSAYKSDEYAGGKGQELAISLGNMLKDGDQVCLVQFLGGEKGKSLSEIIKKSSKNVRMISSLTSKPTRVQYELLDQRWGEKTILLEPCLGEISGAEETSLIDELEKKAQKSIIRSIAIAGDLPEGVSQNFLVKILNVLTSSSNGKSNVSVMLECMHGAEAVLDTGLISLLKLEANEIIELAGIGTEETCSWMEDNLRLASAQLFCKYPALLWIVVTNQMLPPVLFSRQYLKSEFRLDSLETDNRRMCRITNYFRYHVYIQDFNSAMAALLSARLLLAWSNGDTVPVAFEKGLKEICKSPSYEVRCELVNCSDDKGWVLV